MKIFCVLFFLFILHVEAQRRIQTRQEVTNPETSVRGRGRSRFANTETEYSRPSEIPSRRIPSRRKQEPATSEPVEKPNYPVPISSTQSYEVEELIDEGNVTPKLKALPEPNYEPQFISSKSSEADSQVEEKGTSAESSAEKSSAELEIPTVRLDTDRSSLFREDVEDLVPKVNEKAVPITRNNVRSGGNRAGAERRVDVRNGGSRSSERGSRNGNSRNTYEQNVPSSKSSSFRSRGENNISPPKRPSIVEDSGPILGQNVVSEVPSSNSDSSNIVNTISDSVKDENEIRKEIVRNSVPKLPSPLGVGAIPSEPSLPKKTIKKTLRSRVSTNTRNDDSPIPPRGRSNQKIVENFEIGQRAAPIARTVEDYNPSPRGRSANVPSEDVQLPRGKSITTPKNIEASSAGRSRTRATRKPTDAPQVVTVSSRRNGRRRPDSSTTSATPSRRGPSDFSAHEEVPSTRSRTGRRIETVVPKAHSDQTQNSRAAIIRGRTRGSRVSADQLGSSSTKRQNFRSRNDDQITKPSRQRFNPRSPLNIDESKLEVLPLFEGETKIISENGRKPNQLNELISSVAENEIRVIKPPETVTPSISISSDVSTSSKVSSVKLSRRKPQRKTETRETVISQVTEVTSKRTITRKPVSRPGGKRSTHKKAVEPRLNELTSSEENISDSDNYPEPFKALIQSKKQVKESRPSNVQTEDTKTKKIEKLVSSSEAPRSVLATPNETTRTTTYPIKYGADLENEVHPKTSTTSRTIRPTKKRVSLSLKSLETKNNKKATTPARKTVSRSTLAPSKEPKEHKFHSKFNSVTKNNAVPTPKPFNSTAAKGLYFNRKNKDSEKYSINKTRNAIEIGNNRGQYTSAPLHKSSRYSSKYRSSGSSRSVTRASTAPPAYIPTIPSVRSYSSTVKPKEDPELGLEYITFDIPNRSISSANLIKGDYQASEDANSNSLDSKEKMQTTEKPVSIIERIINSITGINITTEPTNINFVAPSTPEPTKSSAILSLAPKKASEKSPRPDDSTQQKLKSNKRDAATSEKPTTIIQRILDSLSAIQAATTTETTTVVTTDTPKQVGTNFNTLSVTTTTPSQLDLETASFSSTLAPSTTINPLVVLDSISDEQVLQKRTIGKLLDILNSLTTQQPDSTKLPETTKLVYVTPKLSNYVYATPSLTSSGTLKPLTSNTITYEKPLTSTQSPTELFTSSVLNTDSSSGENMMGTTTTDRPTITTDAPLSISLGLSTTAQFIEDNVLFSTTPRGAFPIIMNIKSLLALNGISTTTNPTVTTTSPGQPSATSLFTPSATKTVKPSATPLSLTSATPNEPQSITTISTPIMTSSTEEQSSTPTTTSSSNSPTESSNTSTNDFSINSEEPTSSLTTSSTTSYSTAATDSSTMPASTVVPEFSIGGDTNTPIATTDVTSTETIFPYFSTIPTFSTFEVSPDSVSIFSANDLLSNAITPDDFLTSTISIPGKISDSFLSIGKTTHSKNDDKTTNSRQNTVKSSEKTTNSPVETSTSIIQGRITSTPTKTVATTISVGQQITSESTTLRTEDNTTTSMAISTETSANTSNTTPPTTLSTTPFINNGTTPPSGRMGKLLQNVEDEVSNNIDSSSMGPDYFIFAVLPNNTILRKRPLVYPKETPFVVVGVYPNNTVIRKYPNGTLVPMEPVIRVSGFDTRANPPPLPDITSNQVTQDQGNEVDNPKLEMVSTPPSSVNSLNSTTNKPENIPSTTEMTAMRDSTTVESGTTEETSSSSTVIPDNVFSSTTPVPSTTLPSISELLNGKIVQAYNSLVNNTSPNQDSTKKPTTEIISLKQLLSQLKKVKPLETLEENKIFDVDNKVEDNEIKGTTITVPPTKNKVTIVTPTVVTTTVIPSFLSTLITTLQSIGTTRLPAPFIPTTQGPFRFSSTYRAPLDTNTITTTVPPSTSAPTTTTAVQTSTTRPTTTRTVPPTITAPSTTTNTNPTITTTPMVSMSEMQDSSTPPPFTSKPAVASRTGKGLSSTTVFPYFNSRDFPLLSFFSTERPRRTNIDEGGTLKTTTTSETKTDYTTLSEKIETTSESLEELLKKPIDSIKPKKKLTEQQKQDLETIRRLEQEQAAILKQLSLLTNLNLNNLGNGQTSGNLANRLISLTRDRDSRKVKTQKSKPTTTIRTTTTTTEATTLLKSENEAEKERMRQIESLIKLLNMNGVTPSPGKETTYGTSNDAILAALLKERGIGPSTPKQLADHLENTGFFTQTNEVTTKPTTKPTRRTTKKPKTTTQPTRGPLLQRLNWLLDAFASPPTKAPSRKPKKTTTKNPKPKVEEDFLTNEPTHITPVVSPPPQAKKGNSISQDEIQKLIKQLEAIQKDPSAAKNLDLTSFKNLQSLNKDNVQVFMPGSSGVSERETTRPFTRAISQKSKGTTSETPNIETTTVKRKSSARAVRTSTFSPTPVSNSILEDDYDVDPTPKGRATIPPVRLRPVSGVSDDAGSMVRGRLLSAAVNVTRAISGFLGSAFQDAVKNLARSLSSGSLTNFVGSSSIPRNRGESSFDQDYS